MNPKELMKEYLNTKYEIEKLKKKEKSLHDSIFSYVSLNGPIVIDEDGLRSEAVIENITSYLINSKYFPYFDSTRPSAILYDGSRVCLDEITYKKLNINIRDSV